MAMLEESHHKLAQELLVSQESIHRDVLVQLNDCCSSDEGYSGRARKS